MKKTITMLLVMGALLIFASIAALVAEPVQASKTRKLSAGNATLLIPLHTPGEIRNSGTVLSGSVLLGSKDECDITYDHFSGVYWSDRVIPASSLLPTPAYEKVSEQTGAELNLANGTKAGTRTISLSAEKPCGKIVQENLNVIDLYCSSSRTHFAVVGMQDPFMTRQRVVEIAQTLKCP